MECLIIRIIAMSELESPSLQKERETSADGYIISIKISYLFIGFSIIMQVLMLTNIIFACATNFNCLIFFPSPGYLGCFRGHDRLFIAACTLYGFILAIFYIAVYLQFRSRLSEFKRNALVTLSIISSISLPILGLTDEVLGNHIIPIQEIYTLSIFTFVLSSAINTIIIYKEIKNSYVSLKENEKK